MPSQNLFTLNLRNVLRQRIFLWDGWRVVGVPQKRWFFQLKLKAIYMIIIAE